MKCSIKHRVRTVLIFIAIICILLGLFVNISHMRRNRSICVIQVDYYRRLEAENSALLAQRNVELSKLNSGGYPHLTQIQRRRFIRSLISSVKRLERTVEVNHRFRLVFEDVVAHPWRRLPAALLDDLGDL